MDELTSSTSQGSKKRIWIMLGVVLVIVVVFIISNLSFSTYKKENGETTQNSWSKEQNKFRQINFTKEIDANFLDSINPGDNVVYNKPTYTSTSNDRFHFLYFVNGPLEGPSDTADVIKIEINDYVSSDLAKNSFNEVYSRLIKKQENLITKPTLIKDYSDIDNYRAFYDFHYEKDNLYQNRYGISYSFVEQNFYVVITGQFISSSDKEEKNRIIKDTGDKVIIVIKNAS